MEFAFTDEQRMIQETARAFFSENATSERTRAAMAADGIDRALWTGFCQDLGLSGIGIAESAGGAGLGLVELAIIAEAAGAMRHSVYRIAAGPASSEPKLPCPSTRGTRSAHGCASRTRAS